MGLAILVSSSSSFLELRQVQHSAAVPRIPYLYVTFFILLICFVLRIPNRGLSLTELTFIEDSNTKPGKGFANVHKMELQSGAITDLLSNQKVCINYS